MNKTNYAVTMPEQPKVIDFAAYRQRIEGEEEVKMADYQPTMEDTVAFLRVLRYLQHKSSSEQLEVESNADGLTFSITEYHDPSDNEHQIEYSTTSKKLFVPFPFVLIDLDVTELTIHEGGLNTVELFSLDLCRTMMTLRAQAN